MMNCVHERVTCYGWVMIGGLLWAGEIGEPLLMGHNEWVAHCST